MEDVLVSVLGGVGDPHVVGVLDGGHRPGGVGDERSEGLVIHGPKVELKGRQKWMYV